MDTRSSGAQPTFSSDRLRGHRHGTGHALADVAAAAGCPAEDLESYEAGGAEPAPDLLAALASALHIPIDELYSRYDDGSRDYCNAVVQHAEPLSDTDLHALALVMRGKAEHAA